MTRPAGAARGVRVLAGAMVGASAWVSLGTLALTDAALMTRLAALPGWGWLAALAGAGAAAGALLPRAGAHAAPLALLGVLWLPWLPVRVPAAFLLWEGPLEGVVWLAAVSGVGWSAMRAWRARVAASNLWRSPGIAPWIAAALTAVIFVTAWATARPRVPAGDEPHYLVIAQSLLRDGDLRIEDNHRDGQYLAYFDGALKPDFMRRGADGQIYSIHAPGLPVLVLPGFVVAGYAGAVMTVILLGAIGVVLLWRTAFALTGAADAAWIAVAAVSTAAPVLLHGFTVYPDPVAGTLTLAAVWALVLLDRGQQWSVPAAATGAALAVLPWLHSRFAIIAGVLGIALVARLAARSDRGRLLAAFLAVPAVSAVGWFGYFWLIYGTPNPAAPYGLRPEGGLPLVPSGLTGLLADQQFGLLSNAPVLVAGLVALAALARRHARLAIEIGAVVLPYAATAASYPMWWGGYSAPARFLVAVAPLLGLPLAVAWARGRVATRAVVAAALAVSAGVSLALVGIDRGAFIYNGRDGHALLLDWLSQTADLTLALPSVHRDGAAAAAADAVVWIVAGIFVVAIARRLAGGDGERSTLGGRVLGWLATPVAVMVAASIVWAAYPVDVLTAASSQMAWLGRYDVARSSLAFELTPTRALAASDLVRRLELTTSPRGGVRIGAQPLLQIPNVPAGSYDVFVEGAPALAGTLNVRLGRQDLPMETWTLEGRAAGFTGLTLQMPTAAHSITIAGDGAARAVVRRLTLRPRTIGPSGGPLALRAVRYGDVVLFALDDQAFVEPGAMWVRGERSASFIVRPDPGRTVVVRLKAGPVSNQVRLTAGGWRHEAALAPDAAVDVPLPEEALAPAVLTLSSATGFRPSLSADVRWLGVYVTWPPAAAGATGRR